MDLHHVSNMKKKREKSRAFISWGDEGSGWGPGFPLRKPTSKKWGCEIKKEAKLNKPKCVRINPRAPLSLNGSPLKWKARLFFFFLRNFQKKKKPKKKKKKKKKKS